MVMEAPPSPQSVGREFVRQYYTLLNKAPTHLHRFYNHQSSFIHGGLEPPNRESAPVIGQKQIHQKIQQLNFRDCHAKITQVDSQSTLGNGVVVQVTGELSNAGQPMRRFTQTFVLASQSPKKYYVHNDIFRYQDEIISDEECDPDSRSEPEDELLQTQAPVADRPPLDVQQQPLGQPAPGLNPYYGAAAPATPAQVGPPAQLVPQHQPVSAAPVPHHQVPSHVLAQQQPLQAPALNGHPEDLNMMQGQPLPGHLPSVVPQHNLGTAMAPSIPPQEYQPPAPMNHQSPMEEIQQDVEEQISEERVDGGYGDVAEVEPEQDLPSEPASNEPKTFANLFKSASSMSNQPPQNTYQPAPQHQSFGSQSPPNVGGMGNRGLPQTNGTIKPAGPRITPQQPRSSHPGGGRGMGGGRNSVHEEDDRRRQSSIGGSDANQLFLGNLPHIATEEELREIFSEFGRVLDLRVHSFSKPGGGNIKPGASGRAPPNYGFITYESQQSVQICLQARPIYYPKNDAAGTPLNVEEKKNNRDRDRPSYGGKPSGDGNNRSAGGRGDNMGGPRRDRPMGGDRGSGGGMNRGSGGPGGPQGGRSDQRNQGGYGGNRNGGSNRNGPPNSYVRR